MEKNKNKNFENQLFRAMKAAGLLFPISDEQVSEFEHSFGKTEIPLPKELMDSDAFSNLIKSGANESPIKMAAFKKKNDESDEPKIN